MGGIVGLRRVVARWGFKARHPGLRQRDDVALLALECGQDAGDGGRVVKLGVFARSLNETQPVTHDKERGPIIGVGQETFIAY